MVINNKLIKAVFFDLDGTLADTALDLGGALNRLLKAHHYPPIKLDDLRKIAGDGVASIIHLGTNLSALDKDFSYWKQLYLEEYERHVCDETILFDGIAELIKKIASQHLKWGIITNKPKKLTIPLVEKLNFSIPPVSVVSGDSCDEAKPSIKPMIFACELAGIDPQECIYVGDSKRDIVAGKNADMLTIAASWGYIGDKSEVDDWQADYIINKPFELLEILNSKIC